MFFNIIFPLLVAVLSIFVGIANAFPLTNSTCVVSKFSQVENVTKSCTDILIDSLFVPPGVTLKLNLLDGTKVTFRGNTTFGVKNWFGPLVTINGTGIIMEGETGAFFDGQGEQYWDGKGGGVGGTAKPQFFTIQAFHSIFRHLTVINSPQDVVQATNAVNLTFDNWLIDDSIADKGVAEAGKEGINTDGFDTWNSTDIIIQNSQVFNQDDCVAVRNGANILVQNMFCHGSHGLSISVGFSNDSVALNTLRNVTFRNSIMVGGENGIHIKTHNNGGKGSITDVLYYNIRIIGAEKFGIEIQQNYPNGELNNNVPIKNLTFMDIPGSVTSKAVPVYIHCAEGACENFNFTHVFVRGKKDNDCNYKPNGYDC